MAIDLDQVFNGKSQDYDTATSYQPGSTKSDDKRSIESYRRMLDDYRSTFSENLDQQAIDIDYYDGKQLTASERQTLAARGQPDIVVNRSKVAINGILGIIVHSHTDPKAWPRTQEDQDGAAVATDCLRFVTEKNRFNHAKGNCAKDYLTAGIAAILIGASPDNVPLRQIRWEEFFYDPRSRCVDFSDAKYMGIAKWMYKDDVVVNKKWKTDGVDDTASWSGSIGAGDNVMGDRPSTQGWLDSKQQRLMVVELYHRIGKTWNKCVFWWGGVLEEGPSPYKDEYGTPTCPIEAVSCYIDRENNRYGALRDMRDLQDEINKRRSKLLHLVNSSQIQAKDPSAIEVNANEARKEAARPDGVLPYGWEKVPTQDMAQGQMLLLTEAKNEMERFGPNPAVLGRQGADTSGRALLARQQAGLIELAVVLDQLDDWELRVYKAIWARIKQFWTGPMVIRVTSHPDDPTFIGINEPIQNPQAGQPVMAQAPSGNTVPLMEHVPGQDGQPQPDPMNPGQPLLRQVVHPDVLGYKNQVAEIDVDIIVDTQPQTANIMAEQLENLMKLVASNPAYAQQVPMEVFIQLMPMGRKADIIAQIKQFRDTNAKQQAQTAQQQAQMQAQEIFAKIKEMLSKATLNQAKTEEIHADIVGGAISTHGEAVDRVHGMTMDHLAAEAPQDEQPAGSA